jgi:hypothetical protein
MLRFSADFPEMCTTRPRRFERNQAHLDAITKLDRVTRS